MDYMVKYYQNLAEELLRKKLSLVEELKNLAQTELHERTSTASAVAQGRASAKPGSRAERMAAQLNPVQGAIDTVTNRYASGFDPNVTAPVPAPPPMLAADGNNQQEILPPNLPPQNEVPPLIAVGEPGSPGVAPLPATPTPSSFAPIVPGVPIPPSSTTQPPVAPVAPVTPAAAPVAVYTSTSAAPPSGYAPRSAYNFKQDPRYMAGAKDMFQDERKYKAMRGIGLSDYQISKRNEQRAAMDQLRDIEAKKAAGLPVSQRDMQDDAFLRAKYGVGSRNLSAPVKQAYTGLSRPPEGSWEKFQQANQASNAPVPATQSPAANTTAAAASAAAQGRASAKPGSKAESLAKAINPVQAALNRATQTGMVPNVGGQAPAPLVPGPKRPEANTTAAAASAAARGAASPLPGSRAESLARAINPVQAALNRATQTGMAPNRTAIGSGMSEPQETEALTPAQIAARNTLGMGTTPPPAKPRKTAAQRTMGL
jgi:hypothetical protein